MARYRSVYRIDNAMKIENRIHPSDLDERYTQELAILAGIAAEVESLNTQVVGGFLWFGGSAGKDGNGRWMPVKHSTPRLYFTTRPELWMIGSYKAAVYSVLESSELVVSIDHTKIEVEESVWPAKNKDYDYLTPRGSREYSLEIPGSIEEIVEHVRDAANQLDILQVYSTMG